ncbi:hypothetical protein [Acinetobacter sp. LoGeW2-3]|nr:hypothetical protein [Acinetobacter sp. LoGeW2-3]
MALFSVLLGSAVNQPHLERAGGVGQLRGAGVLVVQLGILLIYA